MARLRGRMIAPLILIAAVLLAACGSRGGESTAVDVEPAADTSSPTDFVLAGTTAGTRITVTNAGTDDICYVYVFDHSQGSWGEDRLGAKTLIEPGTGFGLEIAPGIPVNLRADDCHGRNVGQIDEVTLSEDEDFVWALAAGQAGDAQVTLINVGDQAVCFFNFKLSNSEDWGAEKLATVTIIAPTESISYQLAAGTYDFRAHDCSYTLIGERLGEQIDAGERFIFNVDA
ncbi:MAG: hypothetical protein ACE5FI_17040 [Anaerolineales bacterium]